MKKVEISKSSLKKSEKRCGSLEQDTKELEKEIEEVQQAWTIFDRKLEEDRLGRQADIELEQSQVIEA